MSEPKKTLSPYEQRDADAARIASSTERALAPAREALARIKAEHEARDPANHPVIREQSARLRAALDPFRRGGGR